MSLEGLALIAITVFLYGTSTVLQKHFINSMGKFSIGRLVKSPRWLASLGVGILGTLTYVAALRFETFSLVQTLISATIIIPLVAGVVFFKERLSVVEWLAIALILAGLGLALA